MMATVDDIYDVLCRPLRRLFSCSNRAGQVGVHINRPIFLITSTIHVTDAPLCYTGCRSIFAWDERLRQTFQTISSVREKAPGSMVVVLENSELTRAEQAELAEAADWLVCFHEDDYSCRLRDGLYKGAAESSMLIAIMEIIRLFDYERLFKISGRYTLIDGFSLERFSTTQFGVLSRDGGVSTRLYSVPKRLETTYERQLRRCLYWAKKGKSIESVLMSGVDHDDIGYVQQLGIGGYIAIDGTVIRE